MLSLYKMRKFELIFFVLFAILSTSNESFDNQPQKDSVKELSRLYNIISSIFEAVLYIKNDIVIIRQTIFFSSIEYLCKKDIRKLKQPPLREKTCIYIHIYTRLVQNCMEKSASGSNRSRYNMG